MFRRGGLAVLITLALAAPAQAARVNKNPAFIKVFSISVLPFDVCSQPRFGWQPSCMFD